MKLLTKEIRSKLPPLYSQEEKEAKDVMVIVKFFTPWSYWTWYATEFDGEDIFFGYVVGPCPELGTFSLKELESVTGALGLKIERDLHYQPQTLEEVMNKQPA